MMTIDELCQLLEDLHAVLTRIADSLEQDLHAGDHRHRAGLADRVAPLIPPYEPPAAEYR